jgi:hypothetical protein
MLSFIIQTDWQAIADKYGIISVVLIALALFVWKVIWPFMTTQIQLSQDEMRKSNALLQEQLAASHTARERALGEFMAALEKRDDKFGDIVSALNSLNDCMNDKKGQK